MPAAEILRVLGMSPAQWGALPPDVGEGKTNDRAQLRQKAMAIIEENNVRAAATHGGGEVLLKRLDNIEASIRGVSGDITRRFEGLEQRMSTMERGYGILEKAHDTTGKELASHDTRLKKLEK